MLDRGTACTAIARMCAACMGAGEREAVHHQVRAAIVACAVNDCPLYGVRLQALEPPAPIISPERLRAWYEQHHRAAA